MKILYTSILFCSAIIAKAQTVLNYSFENVNTPPCAYNLSNTALNGQILDVTAFGTYGNCDVMSGTCGFGTPQQGNWFLGLSVPPQPTTLSDAIAMKLSTPLIAGTAYQISFYQKSDAGYATNPLEVGYSTNDISQGTVVDTIPLLTAINWTNYTLTFTPTISAQYITFFVEPFQYGWNHIDNVQLQVVSGINSVETAHNAWTVSSNKQQLQINFNSGFKNAIITVFDLQGKPVVEKNIANTNRIYIDTFTLTQSFYFVKVLFNNSVASIKKISLIK